MIQVELFPDFTVVTLRRFFQALQVRVQGFFVSPGGTIDALQHFIVAVATPVSACGFHQLEVMAEAHVRHVRSTAHVDVFLVVIQARLVIMSNVLVKNSDFVVFTTFHEGFTRFVPAHRLLNDVVVALSQLVHTLFEGFDIFLGQRVVKVNVIVKAVVDNRADSHFGVRPQLLDRMTEQVSARVTNDLQTLFVFRGDDRQLRIVFN